RTLDGAPVVSVHEVAASLRDADVVVCATPARTPLFPAAMVRSGCVVIAVGAHEPDARELDGALLSGAQVIVEDVESALRECGDVVLAIDEGYLAPADLIPIRQVA